MSRLITNESDGLNSWDIDQHTGTVNSTTTVRYINPTSDTFLDILRKRADNYENIDCTRSILTELMEIK